VPVRYDWRLAAPFLTHRSVRLQAEGRLQGPVPQAPVQKDAADSGADRTLSKAESLQRIMQTGVQMPRIVSSCLVVSLLFLQQLVLPMPVGGESPNQQFLPLVWRQQEGCDLDAGERTLLELMRDDSE